METIRLYASSDVSISSEEVFCCKQCGYECNADIVGAINILAKGLTMAEMLLKKEQEEQEELF